MVREKTQKGIDKISSQEEKSILKILAINVISDSPINKSEIYNFFVNGNNGDQIEIAQSTDLYLNELEKRNYINCAVDSKNRKVANASGYSGKYYIVTLVRNFNFLL